MTARPRRSPAATLIIMLLGLGGSIAVGCGSAETPAPAVSSPNAPGLTPVPGGSSEVAGLTETAWGRIWNTLPASFPVPGEAIARPAGEGGVSGSFSVGASGETAATLVQAALEEAGYAIESRTTDAGDGAVVIEAVGADPNCRVQVRVTPLSGTTSVAILYGAGCPFD